MRKTIFLLFFLASIFYLSGCVQITENQRQNNVVLDELLDSSWGIIEPAEDKSEKSLSTPVDEVEEPVEGGKIKGIYFEPIPKLVSGASYHRAPAPDFQEIIGQARVRFVNKETGQPIPGFSIDCSRCKDVYGLKDEPPNEWRWINYYPETDLAGWVTLSVTAEDLRIYAARSSNWFEVYFDNEVRMGETKEIRLNPHIIKDDQTLIFPEVSYEKIDDDKTQVYLKIKDTNGQAVMDYNAHFYGVIKDGKRVTVHTSLDNNGTKLIDLPLSGPYRFHVSPVVLPGQSGEPDNTFYQFSVPTGYQAIINLIIN